MTDYFYQKAFVFFCFQIFNSWLDVKMVLCDLGLI